MISCEVERSAADRAQCQTTGKLALSPLQSAYYIGSRPDFDLHVHPHLYLEFDMVDCDVGALESATASLIERHPVLRAAISPSTELYISSTSGGYTIVVHDLTHLSDASQQQRLQHLREKLYRYDFSGNVVPGIDVQVSHCDRFSRVHISLNLLLLDGSSVRLILADLSQHYQSGSSDITLFTFDIAALQQLYQQNLSSERYRRNKDYWLERLKNFPDAPILPLKAYSGPPRRSQLIRRKHLLSREEWAVFHERCQHLRTSASTVLLTLYAKVVSFWCKYSHFYLTYMLQGGEREASAPGMMAANFARTLILEVDFSQPQSLLEHIQQINKRIFLDVTKSSVCGLEVLQEQNRHHRTTARAASPIAFVSMLTDPDEPVADNLFQLEGSSMVFNALETPQVLLDHQVVSRPDGGVALVLDAMDSAFEQGIVEDVFNAYVHLVQRFIDDENTVNETYFDFRASGQIARHQHCNRSSGSLPDTRLHEYLYETAKRQPGNPLVIDGEGEHSYEKILSYANQLAHVLRNRHHVGANELVAVSLPKGWRQIVAVQGILASGAAYVPLMKNWPQHRKAHVLERCGCRVVITAGDEPDELSNENLTMLAIDDAMVKSAPTRILPTVQGMGDMAYVLFTSGSTGTPKGVVLDHLGPANTIEDINRRFGIGRHDRILGVSDLSFDLSVYDIFGAIAAGATLVLPEEGSQQDPARCLQLVQSHAITVWNSVPAIAQLLADYLEFTGQAPTLPVKVFMMSGDWIPLQLPDRLKRYSSAQIYSLGGATEASIWSIYYPVETVETTWKSIPYGYPLSNQSIYVLDTQLQERPDNVPGDIYIGGVGLAKGYWKDEEKTGKSFIDHAKTGQRLYRTGDWGVRRAAGFVDFLGREDGQVKVRGFRIELGEIEAVLKQHPHIESAVVKVEGKDYQTAQLVAFIATRDQAITSQSVQDYLSTRLPGYMIPSKFQVLDELPLNATGKIDRNALVYRDDSHRTETGAKPEPVVTATEKLLKILWSELLSRNAISRHDDFFDLGGTSFSAVRLMVSINDEFGVDMPLSVLLQHAALSDLASTIDRYRLQESSAESTLPVKLSSSRSANRLYWFHPSGGNILCYRSIAQKLEMLVDSYGLNALTRSSSTQPDSTVESLAAEYIARIKLQQPEGPYHLAGWSFGGVLAFEAARQLLAAGHAVDSLLLIDSPVITQKRHVADSELVKWFVSDLCEIDNPDLLTNTISADESIEAALMATLEFARSSGWLEEYQSLPVVELFDIFRRNIVALNQYTPAKLGDIANTMVIMASDFNESRVPQASLNAWRQVLPGNAVIEELSGNHYSLLKPPTVDLVTTLANEHLLSEKRQLPDYEY